MSLDSLELRVAAMETGQLAQDKILIEQSKTLAEQSTTMVQHTDQLGAILRDQRQVITMVSSIEAIIKTGGFIASFIKGTAGIAVAVISIYAAYLALKSGNFAALQELHK